MTLGCKWVAREMGYRVADVTLQPTARPRDLPRRSYRSSDRIVASAITTTLGPNRSIGTSQILTPDKPFLHNFLRTPQYDSHLLFSWLEFELCL